MDELLTAIICKAYFKTPGKRFSYDRMWKTKKQRAFVDHVTDGLYLLQKARLVNDLKRLPKEVRDCNLTGAWARSKAMRRTQADRSPSQPHVIFPLLAAGNAGLSQGICTG
jgi:hypothetical protein